MYFFTQHHTLLTHIKDWTILLFFYPSDTVGFGFFEKVLWETVNFEVKVRILTASEKSYIICTQKVMGWAKKTRYYKWHCPLWLQLENGEEVLIVGFFLTLMDRFFLLLLLLTSGAGRPMVSRQKFEKAQTKVLREVTSGMSVCE